MTRPGSIDGRVLALNGGLRLCCCDLCACCFYNAGTGEFDHCENLSWLECFQAGGRSYYFPPNDPEAICRGPCCDPQGGGEPEGCVECPEPADCDLCDADTPLGGMAIVSIPPPTWCGPTAIMEGIYAQPEEGYPRCNQGESCSDLHNEFYASLVDVIAGTYSIPITACTGNDYDVPEWELSDVPLGECCGTISFNIGLYRQITVRLFTKSGGVPCGSGLQLWIRVDIFLSSGYQSRLACTGVFEGFTGVCLPLNPSPPPTYSLIDCRGLSAQCSRVGSSADCGTSGYTTFKIPDTVDVTIP